LEYLIPFLSWCK